LKIGQCLSLTAHPRRCLERADGKVLLCLGTFGGNVFQNMRRDEAIDGGMPVHDADPFFSEWNLQATFSIRSFRVIFNSAVNHSQGFLKVAQFRKIEPPSTRRAQSLMIFFTCLALFAVRKSSLTLT
jgi:hypothetical protein